MKFGIILSVVFIFGGNYYYEWKKSHPKPLTTEQYENITQFADSLTRDSVKIREMNEIGGFAVGDEKEFHIMLHPSISPYEKVRLLSVYKIKKFEYELCFECYERMEQYKTWRDYYDENFEE